MPAASFEIFRSELDALKDILSCYPKKTLRDDALRERFRNLFRSWSSVVQPRVNSFLGSKRDLHKLTAEVEALAKLTSKIKGIAEYKKRVARALLLAQRLVLFLPPGEGTVLLSPQRPGGGDLFLDGISDLPASLVPNALIGWRSGMEQFLRQHPFDKSVFLMIRYRNRNDALIKAIKAETAAAGCTAILASDHNLTDDLYNPIACLLCCSHGLAVFDQPEDEQLFNPNVAYELGMMHLLGRDCRILKHADLRVLHTDVLMKLYLSYEDVDEAAGHVRDWLQPGDSQA